jgi:RIO kinase 1
MKAELVARGEYTRTDAHRKPKKSQEEVFFELAEEDRMGGGFTPSLAFASSHRNHMSKHELEWILTYLGGFYDDQLITDVLRRVKGGKEATVYCCLAPSGQSRVLGYPRSGCESKVGAGESDSGLTPASRVPEDSGLRLLAGKVYHPRAFRSLKNDALYRQGRAVLDDEGKGVRGRREALAMNKKTSFGQDLRHYSWLASEFETLRRLHAAGADVPEPIAHNDNAILMEYIGDETWPAPPLSSVRLQPGEAGPLFDHLIHNVEVMLSQDVVHADLSAFNVLYWEGKATIIDFPQAVNPYVNPDAYTLFARDVERLCQYFARYGLAPDPAALAQDIWARCIPG